MTTGWRRREAGLALGIAVGILVGGCVAERVTAVEGAAAAPEAGPPSSEATDGPDDSGASESSGGEAAAEPECIEANAVCISSDDNGCNVGGYYLLDNPFNCGDSGTGNTCGPETTFGCTNRDGTVSWVVTSNQAADSTAVLTYPAMQENFPTNAAPTLGSFTKITATFEEMSPPTGSYEDAFNIWLNEQSILVAVWVDTLNSTPPGSQVAQTAQGGRTYDVWKNASPAQITLASTEPFTSGTVDLLGILKYAVQQGLVPQNPTLGQIEFGVDIASTGGQSERFWVNGFSITTTQ
jgi:hypothetical protein